MVKLEATAGTNINHIRRTINTQEVQKISNESLQQEQDGINHVTLLALALEEHQSRLGFLQAYEQNLSKLETAQKELQKTEQKSEFEKQLENMMDIVDNTIFAGEPLFSKAIEYGLEFGTLEGIETEQDIENLSKNISQVRENLDKNISNTSVALVNILSAMGTQNPPENESESHATQLKRIQKLLNDISI
jgi:hypothetical protein